MSILGLFLVCSANSESHQALGQLTLMFDGKMHAKAFREQATEVKSDSLLLICYIVLGITAIFLLAVTTVCLSACFKVKPVYDYEKTRVVSRVAEIG